ncbi:hypothetical protein Pelo_5821 [Pelomyxa schiedti]|nr:hypothetical protein Pelo_5821 [Pelomyxa schiedti]
MSRATPGGAALGQPTLHPRQGGGATAATASSASHHPNPPPLTLNQPTQSSRAVTPTPSAAANGHRHGTASAAATPVSMPAYTPRATVLLKPSPQASEIDLIKQMRKHESKYSGLTVDFSCPFRFLSATQKDVQNATTTPQLGAVDLPSLQSRISGFPEWCRVMDTAVSQRMEGTIIPDAVIREMPQGRHLTTIPNPLGPLNLTKVGGGGAGTGGMIINASPRVPTTPHAAQHFKYTPPARRS